MYNISSQKKYCLIKQYFSLIVCLLFGFNSNSQAKYKIHTQNCLHYKASVMTNSAVENFETIGKRKDIYNNVMGTNVEIYVDTIFKKYTITYLDENYKPMVMPLTFVRKYFYDSDEKGKVYLMQLENYKYALVDLLNMIGVLEISQEQKLSPGITLVFTVKNAYLLTD